MAASRRSFLALGAAAAAQFGAGSVRGAGTAAAPAQEHTVQVDGVPIRLVRAGRGRPVCLIHGGCFSLKNIRIGFLLVLTK